LYCISSSACIGSSGYESMSNTILDEINDNLLKLWTKSIELNSNALWNSLIVRDKSQYHQQRLSQLKHRQNEFKLKLAMIKTFLSMDENKNFDHHDCTY
jgi:hypothetical protein